MSFGQTITPKKTLDFGSFYLDPNGGIIQIDPNSGTPINLSGNATFINSQQSGNISTKGIIGESLDFYFSTGVMSGPGGSITVNNFTSDETSPMFYNVKNKTILFGGDAIYPASLSVGAYSGIATFYYKYTSSSTWKNVSVDLLLEVRETPIQITEDTILNFGDIVADPAGGTIAMNLSGSRSNISGTASFSNTPSVAEFTVQGQPNTAVDITLPNQAWLNNGGSSLKLFNFSADSLLTTTLDAFGQKVFKVTSDLQYWASSPAGVYSGTYTISVNY